MMNESQAWGVICWVAVVGCAVGGVIALDEKNYTVAITFGLLCAFWYGMMREHE